jgi:hypothetical protein
MIYPSLDGYAALRQYGQTIFVIPGLDMIIVTTASLENHDPIFTLIKQHIVPAVENSRILRVQEPRLDVAPADGRA